MKTAFHFRSLVAGLVVGAGLAGLAVSSIGAPAPDDSIVVPVQFALDQEPLIVYDISGFGLAGPIHRHFTLYTSGLATISSASNFGAPTEGTLVFGPGDAGFKYVSPAKARQVWKRTIVAGGLDATDGGFFGADVPTSTITIFERPGRTSNTFNFLFAQGQAAEVATIINAFIAEEFPDF